MSHVINFLPVGRTGNILFQVAATMAYGKKYGVQWGMPTDTREVPHFRKMFPNVPVLDGHFRRKNYTDPSQFNYEPLPNFGCDTTLVGFFQSQKYFEGFDDEVKKLFKLDIQPEYKDFVSIHVRRGDYVEHSNSFPPVTVEYILRAMQIFMDSNPFQKFLFFSDDIQWVKENINLSIISCGAIVEEINFLKKCEDAMFKYFEPGDEFKSLSAMASCSHNIIANSTFSWWAAWLNPNPDKIVVSPCAENWFGPGFTGSVPVDLIPDSWYKIHFR